MPCPIETRVAVVAGAADTVELPLDVADAGVDIRALDADVGDLVLPAVRRIGVVDRRGVVDLHGVRALVRMADGVGDPGVKLVDARGGADGRDRAGGERPGRAVAPLGERDPRDRSVPVTLTASGPRLQPVGVEEVFTGSLRSICTRWSTHSVHSPPESWTRCEKRWMPSPVTVASPPGTAGSRWRRSQSTTPTRRRPPAATPTGSSCRSCARPGPRRSCRGADRRRTASTARSSAARTPTPRPAPERRGRRKRVRLRLCESEGSRPGYRQVSSDLQSPVIQVRCERTPRRSRDRNRCPRRARSPPSRRRS